MTGRLSNAARSLVVSALIAAQASTDNLLQGDPSAVPYAVESVQELLGQKPMFGICMGHQLLGQAFGGKTFKLKFGHHGGNHPVRHNASGAEARLAYLLLICACFVCDPGCVR